MKRADSYQSDCDFQVLYISITNNEEEL